MKTDSDRNEKFSRLLIVAPAGLFPVVSGSPYRSTQVAEGMTRYFSEVVLYEWGRSEHMILSEAGVRWSSFTPARPISSGWAAKRLEALGLPHAEHALYLPATEFFAERNILPFLEHYAPSFLQVEFPAAALPLTRASRRLRVPLLFASHNIESLRMADLYPDLPPRALEWLKSIDRCAYQESTVATTVSAREAREVAQLFNRAGVEVFPNGVRRDAFEKSPRINLRRFLGLPDECFIILFHGELTYPPNIQAFVRLSGSILPELLRRGICCRLVVVGRGSDQLPLHPAVVTLGEVDDPLPFIRDADLAILPLDSGRGTRIKALEYLAAGVPTVATMKAVEGLSVADGAELRIADTDSEISDVAEELLCKGTEISNLTKHGQKFARGHCWDDVLAKAFERIYQPALFANSR